MKRNELLPKSIEREDKIFRLSQYIKGMKKAKITEIDCNGEEKEKQK